MRSLSLSIELARWRLAGRRARLWWRDDDAAGATPELHRLLAVSARTATPLTLAVIPSGDMAALAPLLAAADLVDAVQHGVEHQNNRTGPAGGEFPPAWPRARLGTELRRGWGLIADLPGALPVFVPPWNDVHPALEGALGDCGFAGWSANGVLESPGLARIDVHLDLLRWRGGARFRGRRLFLADLRRELARRRRSRRWDTPIGLLTHHLDHDADAWAFLQAFLAWTRDDQPFDWVSLRALVAAEAAAPGAGEGARLRPTPRLMIVRNA